MPLKHQNIWTKSHSKRQHTVVCMSHSGHPILPITLDMTWKSAQHTDECEIESLASPIHFFCTCARSHKSWTSLFSKFLPWSIRILLGHPWWTKKWSKNVLATTVAGCNLVIYAWAYLVKWSVTTKIFLLWSLTSHGEKIKVYQLRWVGS